METVVKDEEEEGGLGGQMKKQIPFEWVPGSLVRRRATRQAHRGAAIKRDRPYFLPRTRQHTRADRPDGFSRTAAPTSARIEHSEWACTTRGAFDFRAINGAGGPYA